MCGTLRAASWTFWGNFNEGYKSVNFQELATKQVTIRVNNSPIGLVKIGRLWHGVRTGSVPLLTHAAPGQFPIACYSHYESDSNGLYDFTILLADAARVQQLKNEVARGAFRQYAFSGKDVSACAIEAWRQVWHDEKTGALQRAYTQDFEVSTPAEHTPDGVARCTLYIAQLANTKVSDWV